MASNAGLVSEDQLLCAICLDTFTQPVSTTCGHNFCLSCLSSYWDKGPACHCPICNHAFQPRPDLKVNTFISALVSQLTSDRVTDGDTRGRREEGGDRAVPCDICADAQNRAVKSCLECLTSYCSQHLEPHHRAAGLKRHTLIDPVSDLPARVCTEHARKVELFCLDDKEMLCDVCAGSRHSTHRVVPLQQAHQVMRKLLGGTEERAQQRIQELQARVRAKEDAIASSEQEFTAMVSVLRERQQAAEKEARLSIGSLQRELAGLQAEQLKLRELKQTGDQIAFLRSCRSLPRLPHVAELSSAGNVDAPHIRTSAGSCLSQLQTLLRKQTQEMRSLMLCDDQLRKLRQYEVSITLDPNTANFRLVLSGDGKQVRFNTGPWKKSQVTKPSVFVNKLAVLGRRGFRRGKFYFEVFMGKKTEWCLGVATASIQRKQHFPRGPGHGLWALWFIVDRFESWSSPGVTVFSGRAERIGVFVDYDKGEMLFYDVDTPTFLHSFTDCRFTEKIYPYFNPCNNEHHSNLDPMIIVPSVSFCGSTPQKLPCFPQAATSGADG